MARRPVTTIKFVRFLRLVTLGFSVPAVPALGSFVGNPFALYPLLFGGLIVGLVVWALGWRIRLGFQDRRRSRWMCQVVLPSFDALWCSLLGSLVFFLPALGLLRWRSLTQVFQLALLTAAITAIYGVFVRRHITRVRRIEVSLPDLPPGLDGYRVVQLSDLHVGSSTSLAHAMGWVVAANRLKPDLIAVTGDVLTTGTEFHDDVVEVLGALQAGDAVAFCFGNHDYYNETSLADRLTNAGVRVLRNDGFLVKRNGDVLFVAGVEDLWRGNVDIDQALSGRPSGVCVLLLAHNPMLFDLARQHAVSLTLSGHTHAGQVAIPYLGVGPATFTLEHVKGLYRAGKSTLFVHAGLGTTGPSIRLGAAPEIVEITLRTIAGQSLSTQSV